MADVFISYHRSEGASALVRRIAAELESMGISYWYDKKHQKSGRFGNTIEKEIERCKVFLLIWDDGANQSLWCIDEVFSAREHKKLLIPFQLGQFEKHPELLLRLRGFNTYYGGNSPANANISEIIGEISDILQAKGHSTNVKSHGKNGKKITYALDNDGTLTISGHGAMWFWFSASGIIWCILLGLLDLLLLRIQRDSSYFQARILIMLIRSCILASVLKIIFEAYIAEIKFIIRRTEIFSVYIENGVTSIGMCAFKKCSNLDKVTIPKSVTRIGNSAFEGCTNLSSIIIPDSVTSIGDFAFECCRSLKNIKIPDRVTSVGDWAFKNCSSLKSVTIPDSVTSISKGIFDGCSSLISITIPDSVTSIERWAFDGCGSLKSIAIPDSVISIGKGAFRGCSSLTSVTIPDSVTSIGIWAFSRCHNLKRIQVPANTKIADNAFPEHTEVITHFSKPHNIT